MIRMRYSKKIDAMLKKGISMREIRNQLKKSKKGQLLRVQNIIVGLVIGGTALIMFLLASPTLKDIISQATASINSPVVSFIITAIPFIIMLMIIVYLITAFRGDANVQ